MNRKKMGKLLTGILLGCALALVPAWAAENTVSEPEIPSEETTDLNMEPEEVNRDASDEKTEDQDGEAADLAPSMPEAAQPELEAEQPDNPEVTEITEKTEPVKQEARSVQNGWVKTGGKWYYYENGAKAAGWRKVCGIWYYMNPSDGVMQTGWLLKGKWYYLDGSGAMQTGWVKVGGTWYYMDGSGAMQTGWKDLDGKRYYLQSSGAMQKGWLKQNGDYYFFNGSGALRTGSWYMAGNRWFYSDSKGVMYTEGWHKINGKWYYMNSGGDMRIGWLLKNSKWYYLGGSGAMQTGWYNVGTKQYYSDGNGVMASSQWIDSYFVGKSGAMYTDCWALGDVLGKKPGKWYYFKSSGKLAGQGGVGEWVGGTGIGHYYIDKTGYMFTLNNGGYPEKSLSNGFGKDENGRTKGYIFTFDSSGKCIARRNRFVDHKDPLTGKNVHLEEQFDTDPQIGTDITKEDFLTAVLYTEAGDQKKSGMMMVGYVIMNRLASSSYPNTLEYLIYQENYFEVTRDGSLTKVLTNLKNGKTNVYYERARDAAHAILAGEDIYNEDGTLLKKKAEFDYMYFMTPSSFEQLGLSKTKCDIYEHNGHIYFKYYIKD